MTASDFFNHMRTVTRDMSLRTFIIGCSAAWLTSCAASSDQGEATNELASNEVIVCEDVATTGTRFAKRVCWTETQREGQESEGRRLTEEVMKQSTVGTVQSGPGTFGPPTTQSMQSP